MMTKAVVRVREDVLPPGAAAVAEALARWPGIARFYLTGGTALALHLGHRRSRDLDFFTRVPVDALPEIAGEREVLGRFPGAEVLLRAREQVVWRLGGVAVTLLAYPFPHRFAFHDWRGLAVADPREVALQKAYVLGRRAQARDYVDLHAVLTAGLLDLDALVRLAAETYGEAFSARLFLQQLTYTRDLPDREDALGLLVVPRPFAAIERELEELVRAWARRRFSEPPSAGGAAP